ncbi:hypothetical protein FACS189468_2750 [Spirochaetia bacterium]|nr:hypothetical protein FACS189468_2750 [Spirochaetia bacterium]
MENNRIVRPLYAKIILPILDVYFIFGEVPSIYSDKNIRFGQIVAIICLLSILLILTYYTYIVYILNDDDILVKYPFGKCKKYFVNDITGFRFSSGGADGLPQYILYFNEKELNIPTDSKKSKLITEQFLNKNYEKIKDKNMLKIINDFIEITVKHSLKIKFYKDRLEIIKKDNIVKTYYYEDIREYKIKEVFMKKNDIIVLIDGHKIKLENKCIRFIGLFDYILKNI